MLKRTLSRPLSGVLVLCLAIALSFGAAVNYGATPWDDHEFIFSVKAFQNPSLDGVLRFWKSSFGHMYLPVTYTIVSGMALVSRLFPASDTLLTLNPQVFHRFNLMLHMVISCVVFLVLRTVLIHSCRACRAAVESNPEEQTHFKLNTAALFGALVFALHPVQTEPVVWISGIKDLAFGLFAFPAIYLYLRYLVSKGTNAFQTGRYLLSLLLFVLAILAKPAAVMVPVILWIMAVGWFQRDKKRATVELLLWLLISLPVVVIIIRLQSGDLIDYVTPIWLRPFIMGDNAAFYLKQLLMPFHFSIIYDQMPEQVLSHWTGYVSWLIPAGLGVLLWLKRRELPWLGVGYLVFLAGFFTVSGVVPFIFQNSSGVADRYLYLSMLGPAIAVSGLVYFYPRKLVVAGVFLVICAMSVRSHYQTGIWREPAILFEHALEYSRHVSMFRNLGKIYMKEKRSEEAIAVFSGFLEDDFDPETADRMELLVQIEVMQQLAYAHNTLEKRSRALAYFRKERAYLTHYLQTYPGDYKALVRLANTLNNIDVINKDTKNTHRAIEAYQVALDIKPDLTEVHLFLGSSFRRVGEPEKALFHLQQELSIDPENPEAHSQLALNLLELGQQKKALFHAKEALRLDPRNKKYRSLYNAVLSDMAAQPFQSSEKKGEQKELSINTDPEVIVSIAKNSLDSGNYSEAEGLLKQALMIDASTRRANYLLAVIYRKNNRLEKAVTHYQRELEIAPDQAEVHNDLGIVLIQLGQKKQGIDHLQKAVALEPDNPSYQANLNKAARL